MVKKHQINVRMDDDAKARLVRLANALGLDTPEALRYAVKQCHDIVCPPPPRSEVK